MWSFEHSVLFPTAARFTSENPLPLINSKGSTAIKFPVFWPFFRLQLLFSEATNRTNSHNPLAICQTDLTRQIWKILAKGSKYSCRRRNTRGKSFPPTHHPPTRWLFSPSSRTRHSKWMKFGSRWQPEDDSKFPAIPDPPHRGELLVIHQSSRRPCFYPKELRAKLFSPAFSCVYFLGT